MQIRKCWLAVCFAVAALSVQAADTDAQVKAREALQKKLQEIDAQAPVTNAPAPVPPAPPAAPAPAAAPAPTPAEPPPPQPVPAAAAAAATAAAVAEPAPAAAAEMGAVPVPADPAVIDKAREAMHKKMDELVASEPQAPVPPVTPQPGQKPNPPKPAKSQPSDGLPPIPGPDSPISAGQQQQLSALLQRYKADEITPDQYQAERAKILQAKN